METIIVSFWSKGIRGLSFNHDDNFAYSEWKKIQIVDEALEKNYSVMLVPNEPFLIIWIDNGKFR